MKLINRIRIGVVCLALFAGCDSAQEDECASMPLFLIGSATDSTTNQPISRLTIDQASYAPDPDQPHIGGRSGIEVLRPFLQNTRIEGGALVCDVPCAFGRASGHYWFRVAAPGFDPVGYAYASRDSHREAACAGGHQAVWRIDAVFPSQ